VTGFGFAHRGHAAHDREHARNEADRWWQEQRGLDLIETDQVLAERVHDAVERAVRHGLAFEAAADELQRIARYRHGVGELTRQGALADARFAADDRDDRRVARAAIVECSCELVELGRAADERHRLRDHGLRDNALRT
jgi:hypothetical protein